MKTNSFGDTMSRKERMKGLKPTPLKKVGKAVEKALHKMKGK